jgi:hypothetical protein
LVILPEPIWRKACLAHEAWFNHGTKTDSGFMSGSLPELSPVEVYVIHQMHLADVFSFGNQFGGEKARFCAIFTQNESLTFWM